LIGPERSGTGIHIDPLNTSAWNTSFCGHKRWVLFPESVPKFVAKGKAFRGKDYVDESINYFTEILPALIESEGRERLGVIEFVQKPGETVFVPGGWWHAVVNLDDTMAITQNVMNEVNFEKVWRSIRSERRKFAQKFLHLLEEKVHIGLNLGSGAL
jgi:histone arginine demethylase JMJD6